MVCRDKLTIPLDNINDDDDCCKGESDEKDRACGIADDGAGAGAGAGAGG